MVGKNRTWGAATPQARSCISEGSSSETTDCHPRRKVPLPFTDKRQFWVALDVWLAQVFAAPLAPACFKVAYALRPYLALEGWSNFTTFVGQRRIAADASLSLRTVRDSLHTLADHGHVELIPGTGQSASTLRPIMTPESWERWRERSAKRKHGGAHDDVGAMSAVRGIYEAVS